MNACLTTDLQLEITEVLLDLVLEWITTAILHFLVLATPNIVIGRN